MKFNSLIIVTLMWIGPCDDSFSPSQMPGMSGECIEVKYVAGICGEVVLAIETKEYQSLGESWNGNDHVFFTILPCETDESTLKSGNFKVFLKESNSLDFGECIRCKATVGYTGKKRYEIAFSSTCGNN